MNHNNNHRNHHSHNHHRPIHHVNTTQPVVIIAIPPTTSTTVVFPSTADGRAFDSGFYSPGLTDGRASFEEINQFLTEINDVRTKIQSQTASGMCCRVTVFFFVVILYVLGMVFITQNDPELIPVGIIGFIILAVCLVIFQTKKLNRIRTEFQAKCQAIVNQHNQNFASRGLRWHLPVYFPRWVELWKDYSVNQGVIGQPFYLPPVNQQPYGVPVVQNTDQFHQNNYYQNYQAQGQTENKNVYTPPSQF